MTYPVALDNQLGTFTNYRNRYWPADYLIDATGTVRHINFGEGNYANTEQLIRQLLTDADPDASLPADLTDSTNSAPGVGVTTPETYLTYGLSTNYIGSTPLTNGPKTFTYPAVQPADTYGLNGPWNVESEHLTAEGDAGIELNYHATKVYAVLGGTGTVTVTRNGEPGTTFEVSGPPHAYPLFEGTGNEQATLTLNASSGIQAFTFSFG